MKFHDITGEKHNKLTVLGVYGNIPSNKYKSKWRCQCECGNITIVSYTNIVYNNTKSCGCADNKVKDRDILPIHGLSSHRLYNIHKGMIERCYRTKARNYPNYGGRGITICSEWYTPGVKGNPGFLAFYNWSMENGYSDELSIDRLDVNGPYAPWNCRWATRSIQDFNKRSTGHIIDGKDILSYTQFAKRYNHPINYVSTMLKYHWTKNAIIHKERHPELQLHRPYNMAKKKYSYDNSVYLDKDGFQVLIPRYSDQ